MIEADWMFVDTLTMAVEAANLSPNDTEVDIRYTIRFDPAMYALDIQGRSRKGQERPHLGRSVKEQP